jgi:hypothetical protein
MARGIWSFLHEWAIYEYLMTRFDEGALRFKAVRRAGKYVGREKWIAVSQLQPIKDSRFPDVKSITLTGETSSRSAEVKFTTSEFNYHKDSPESFREKFVSRNGFILVLAHDHLPSGLDKYNVDVFELDRNDFETWCRANFTRLFNRQIGSRAEPKIWIMYQGPNFNDGTSTVKPARESHRWCPTENLTGFDLAPGDRVLFVRTSGASTQLVQRAYLAGRLQEGWFLEEIYVAEVRSKIYSQQEYCEVRKIAYENQLWRTDPKRINEWRWGRVFEFYPITCINKKTSMKDLREKYSLGDLVDAITQAFCFGKSRQIENVLYTRALESLVGR